MSCAIAVAWTSTGLSFRLCYMLVSAPSVIRNLALHVGVFFLTHRLVLHSPLLGHWMLRFVHDALSASLPEVLSVNQPPVPDWRTRLDPSSISPLVLARSNAAGDVRMNQSVPPVLSLRSAGLFLHLSGVWYRQLHSVLGRM